MISFEVGLLVLTHYQSKGRKVEDGIIRKFTPYFPIFIPMFLNRYVFVFDKVMVICSKQTRVRMTSLYHWFH